VPSRPFAARIRAELQLKQTDSWAEHTHNITIEVVERPRAKGFVLLPRRWVVERIFAWITRRRRCARDYERLPEHHETIVYLAAALHMIRRAARLTTT
jgi:transposase